MEQSYVLLFLLMVPALTIGLIMVFPTAPARGLAILSSVLNFFATLVIFGMYDVATAGYQFEFSKEFSALPGLPSIFFHLGMDGINGPLVFLATTVTLAAIWVSPADVKRARAYYVCLLLMSLGAIGAFLSLDLFFFFIFHEFALIPTFLLIGIWGGQNRQFAAMQMTIYLMAGSLVLLAGILGLVLALPPGQQTFNLPEIQKFFLSLPPDQLFTNFQILVFPLLALGFGILISLFPFHSWAAPGYAAAPPAAAMLHAGVLKKFGLYGVIRIATPLLPAGPQEFGMVLWILLLGNILWVGYVTVAQKELPLMLGFSSVMHMGYLFLGIAAWNSIGLSGVVFLMVAHGLSSSLLWALSGEITQRTGETRMTELGGLGHQTPFLATAFIIGSLASVGMPGLCNFPGELLVFFGAVDAYRAGLLPMWLIVLAVFGIVVGAIYQLRAVSHILFGPLPEKYKNVSDIEWHNRAPYILLIAIMLILGFVPSLILNMAEPSIQALLKLNGGS